MYRRSLRVAVLIGILVTIIGVGASFAQTQASGNPAIACVAYRYAKSGALSSTDLLVMDADGSHQTDITSLLSQAGAQIRYPGWSPDLDPATPGYQGRIIYSVAGYWTLWTIDVSIGGSGTFTWTAPRQIPLQIPNPSMNTWFAAYSPAWSPSGEWIALDGGAGTATAGTESGLYVIPPSGGTPVQVVVGSPDTPTPWHPCWDPLGESVSFGYSTALLAEQIVPAPAGAPSTIVTNAFPYVSGTAQSSRPSWSAAGIAFKGTTIVSSRRGQTATSALYVVNPNAAGLPVDVSQLISVPGTSDAGDPSWSHGDQSLIAAIGTGIAQINPTTGAQTLLAANTKSAVLKSPSCRR